MKISRSLLLFACMLFIAACGKTTKTDFFGVEEEAVKPKVKSITKLTRNWRIGLGDRINRGDAVLSPALFGNDIYVATIKGKIDKVSAESGKRVWQAKIEDERITAGVGVGSGLVLVGTDNGFVYAFKQEDGSQAWRAQLDSEVLASPVVGSDVVVAPIRRRQGLWYRYL